MRSLRYSIAILALCSPLVLLAQTLRITPALVDSSEPIEQALSKNAGHTSATIKGKGKSLNIKYTASEPIDVFMVPTDNADNFVPTDFVRFTLPKTENGDVEIDLTVSPGWSPKEISYIVYLLSEHESADVGIVSLEFIEPTFLKTVSAAFKHFFTAEPYSPSSYHALRGYRFLGISFVPVLGLLGMAFSVLALVFFSKERRLHAVTGIWILATMIYGLRLSIDLVRFSAEHVPGYLRGQYDEAGSAYDIGALLSTPDMKPKDNILFVCRDGTNFKEKLLRYASYPLRVTSDPSEASGATLALVMDKLSWNMETVIDKKGSRQILHCGPIAREAVKIQSWPDGSILYSLTQQ